MRIDDPAPGTDRTQAPAVGAGERDPKTWKAAQDFEAMAIGQMLQPMFDTVKPENGQFGGGAGEASFRPMLVTEMAKAMERHGGIGLADSIYAQMMRLQENKR
ncbi:MAG: rod-binding protein [Gluconacetobacter diazotrophicus]|nr:rod-binding protein [Gluconacetobacter diazotrophicus]